MNDLTDMMTMLVRTPYLSAALITTFMLLGLEVWLIWKQSQAVTQLSRDDVTSGQTNES